jgi:N-acetylmuramidase
MQAAAYNRSRFGIGFTLRDLPLEWTGAQLLSSFDLDGDLTLSKAELDGVDWTAFTGAVRDVQAQAGFSGAAVDGKLGRDTLAALKAAFPAPTTTPTFLLTLGDLELPPAEERIAPPPKAVDERGGANKVAVARLWNSYGGAILEQATAADVEPAVALAIFAVESKRAYDPTTGLVIVRFEPKVFLRRSGRLVTSDHSGQLAEWQAIEEAYALNPKAALESASYGLPQLMGFNFGVTTHADARALLLGFQRSAREQVAGFFGFVAANGLVDEARERRFVAFARRYNGLGKQELYGAKMKTYFTFAKQLLT